MSVADAMEVDRPAPPVRGWSRERVLGHALLGLWALFGLLLVWFLASSWKSEMIAKYAPSYWSGVKVTLSLVAISIVIGAILSVPIAYARMSKNRILSVLAYCYVYFFRGTPLLAQTFLIYYGVGSFKPQLEMVGLWGFFRDAFNCAIFAFSLNTAAYQAEVLRGAVQSVPKGQWEAAAAQPTQVPPPPRLASGGGEIRVVHHRVDDSVFVDGTYIVKGIAGALLRLMLEWHLKDGSEVFTNREMRLALGGRMPEIKDNLETRLLLLRRRLEEKQAPIQIVRVGRGRIRLEATGPLLLDAARE